MKPDIESFPAARTKYESTRAKLLPRPKSLFEWIIVFAALVVGSLGLLCAAVAYWWPSNWPLTAWEVLAGLSSSAVIALVAGILTISISWETSLHFGRISTTEIAEYLQDSLASTLDSAADFLVAAREILRQVESESLSLVVIAFPTEQLLGMDQVGSEVASLIRKRFERDAPTVLALTTPSVPKGLIWEQLAYVASDETEFRQRFTKRRSFVITVPSTSDALIVLLEPTQGSGFSIMASAFAFPVSTSTTNDYAGIRSEVDRGFGRMVLERFYTLIQEPTASYAHSVLSASDVLSGQYIGLSVTRSIITSQLIQSAATVQRFKKDKGECWIDIINPDDPQKRIQFLYSSSCFCPPLYSGQNHSGSVIAEALRNNQISVTNKTVWEVGCGPGYVTLQLADKVGESGIVLATDIDVNASNIAKRNIAAVGLDSRVTFINGDCTQFNFKTNDDPSPFILIAPDGVEYRIDMIFLELPLLPYWGTRELSPVEVGYFEAVPHDYQYLLPPTIIKLLLHFKSNKVKGVVIVLPVAGSPADLAKVIEEVKLCIGESCSITILNNNEERNSFITPLLIQV